MNYKIKIFSFSMALIQAFSAMIASIIATILIILATVVIVLHWDSIKKPILFYIAFSFMFGIIREFYLINLKKQVNKKGRDERKN